MAEAHGRAGAHLHEVQAHPRLQEREVSRKGPLRQAGQNQAPLLPRSGLPQYISRSCMTQISQPKTPALEDV